MKKYLVAILSISAFVGCSQEALYEQLQTESVDSMPVFEAISDQGDKSRAELTNDLKINWQTADQISIFNKNVENLQYQLEGEGGSTTGTFKAVTKSVTATPTFSYYGAIYPYNKSNAAKSVTVRGEGAESTDGLQLTYTIPATQYYTANSFDKTAFPMVAVSATEDLSFKNACGILKLQLTSELPTRVKSITVTGNNDEILSGTGTATLTVTTGATTGTPSTWTAITNTSKTVTLDCGTSGVLLSETEPTIFHITLPPTTFSKGFTVEVTNTDGKTKTFKTTSKQTISRNQILRMPTVNYEITQAKLIVGYQLSQEHSFNLVLPNDVTKLTFKSGQAADPLDKSKKVSSEDSPYAAYIIKDPNSKLTTEYFVVTTADEFLFNANCSHMFDYKKELTEITFEGCNITEVNDMSNMFNTCSALKTLNLGPHFNTRAVMNMYRMFKDCSALQNLNLGPHFNTRAVTNMSAMFEGCSALTTLNLGDFFDTSAVTNMSGMFQGCSALKTLNLGSYFNTSKVTSMHEMFLNCSSLTVLDLGSNFKSSNELDITSMFEGLGNGFVSGTKLVFSKETDFTNVKYFAFMFKSARLSSITCTSTMWLWITKLGPIIGWNYNTEGPEFQWIDVENNYSM